MSLKELEGFLNDGQKDDDGLVNWSNHKKEWLKAMDLFYEDVTTWLKPLIGQNLSLHFEKVVLQEDYIGSYETRKMVIYAKGQKVLIEPKGTLIIGAKGRIDMVGPYGQVRFVYVDKRLRKPNISIHSMDSTKEKDLKKAEDEQVDFEWKIATMPPNIQFIPLNEETFSDSLLSVIQYG